MTDRSGHTKFRHPVAFWLGSLACAVGVVLHLRCTTTPAPWVTGWPG